MKKLVVLLTAIAICNFAAKSQETLNNAQPKFKVTNFSSSIGNLSIYHQDAKFNELKEITMNSENFYEEDLKDYESYAHNQSNVTSFNLNIGLTPYSNRLKAYKKNHEIQVGFTMNSGYRRGFYFYKQDSNTIDSIKFHGSTIKADSLNDFYIDYDEYVNDVSLSLAYLLKTDNNKKLGAYAGLAADVGFTFLSEVETQKSFNSSVAIIADGTHINPDLHYNNSEFESNTEDLSNSLFVRAAIPVGFSYRLSNKDCFLNLVEVFSQGKFGFEYQRTNNQYNYLNALLGISGGLKFNIG